MRRAAALALLVAGCGAADVCDRFGGQSCLSIELRGSARVDQVRLTSDQVLLPGIKTPVTPRTPPVALPVDVALALGTFTGAIDVLTEGLLGGQVVGAAHAQANVGAAQHVRVTVTLGSGSDGGAANLATALDLAGGRDLATRADLALIPCSTLTQAPCPVGQKCMFITTGQVFCQPDGTRKVGQSCNGFPNDDCQRGSECLFPGGADGVCTQFCGVDADCEQAAVAVGGVAEPMNLPHCIFNLGNDSLKFCSLACNPVAAAGNSGCPADAACEYESGGAINELTFCDQPGPGLQGQTCPNMGNCAAGLSCVGGAAGPICVRICRAGRDFDCTGSDTCHVLAGAGSMFGYCCPPAGC